MSDAKSNYFEEAFMKLVFHATSIATLAQDSSGGGATDLVLALHTADPGETGTQDASEANYTGYARLKVARTTAAWTVTTLGVVNPTTVLAWPAASGGTNTITHGSLSLSTVAATNILWSGTISPNISVSAGITPQMTSGFTISET